MFSNFVSLGTYCATAASASKYGLRSWSGPFDWLITEELKWVLYFIENDFEYFLEKEDLERWDGDPRAFRNKMSGFGFVHEREYLFEEEFDKIKEKYKRRIKKFLKETEKPTCFLRWVVFPEEIEYIRKNSKYIREVIKKRNGKNEIVFLIKHDMKMLSKNLPYKSFYISVSYEGKSREATRRLYDYENEFLLYCASNFNAATMMKNLIFDHCKEDKIYDGFLDERTKIQIENTRNKRNSERYQLLVKLLEYNFDDKLFPPRIIIYGAGNIGTIFYKKVKQKSEIVYFVDKTKAGQKIDGVLIKEPSEIDYNERATIIVTPTYAFEEICKDIRCRVNDKVKIISLYDIVKDK